MKHLEYKDLEMIKIWRDVTHEVFGYEGYHAPDSWWDNASDNPFFDPHSKLNQDHYDMINQHKDNLYKSDVLTLAHDLCLGNVGRYGAELFNCLLNDIDKQNTTIPYIIDAHRIVFKNYLTEALKKDIVFI